MRDSRPALKVRSHESGTLGAKPLSPVRIFSSINIAEARTLIGDSNMSDAEVQEAIDECAALARIVIEKFKQERN
ncbi:MAG: hypothetical protein AAB372_01265 [Patescibacteria group bacterium]